MVWGLWWTVNNFRQTYCTLYYFKMTFISVIVIFLSSAPLTNSAFWWTVHTQSKWFSFSPVKIQHYGCHSVYLENRKFYAGNMNWNNLYISLNFPKANLFCMCVHGFPSIFIRFMEFACLHHHCCRTLDQTVSLSIFLRVFRSGVNKFLSL
jgi:hypothetical protein